MHGDTAQALLNLGSWWGSEGLPGITVPIFELADFDSGLCQNICLPLVDEGIDGNYTMLYPGNVKKEFSNETLEEVAADEGEGEVVEDDDMEDPML